MQAHERERITQDRVIHLLTDRVQGLGWTYLGDWQRRQGNSNIDEVLLRRHLKRAGYSAELIGPAIAELKLAATVDGNKLYEANKQFHEILRYGIDVSPGPGQVPVQVHFIIWDDIPKNEFGVAEEVSIEASNPKAFNKRPDIVLYVNGIALGTLELKRSTISVSEGIRQTLDNQKPNFIRDFFSTIQITLAGNDSQGLRYAPIETPERYWLTWKEESSVATPLDRDIPQLLSPERFLEIIHDFTVFDGGIRKAPRPNQYFAIKAAQKRIPSMESGIIWQTQGSGKSLLMVMLARWIKENLSSARILIITDRKELDDQIVDEVFGGVGEVVRKAKSGYDLLAALADEEERVICSLVHKFGKKDSDETGRLIDHIRTTDAANPKGNFFVFVDECHRTQSGKLASAMRKILPDAMFIGFTGTPLLKSDKATSLETFGPFIGTPYKFDEAVSDGVVLDLRYEARDIDQRINGASRIDEWFETRTAGLTAPAKAALKKRWGTLQTILSSKDRLTQIVNDITLDMGLIPRLAEGKGNAILVAGSIPEACKLFDIIRASGSNLSDKVALITSYKRQAASVTGEETGMGETDRQTVYTTYDRLLTARNQSEEEYEEEALKLFREQPAQMKLLIVVSRLLTGFDAPPATYIYIDKKMKDHGLFQAICRVNRLDDGKDYGYIVDYKDLFKCIEGAVDDYTSEAFENFDHEDVEGLISNRAEKAVDDFHEAREAWLGLMEPVAQPRGLEEIFDYFSSGDVFTDPAAEEKARRRQALYKMAGRFVSTFAAVADDLAAEGYAAEDIEAYRKEVEEALSTREAVELHSADAIDLKQYEPEMRRLIDMFVGADAARRLSSLNDMSLVELIAERQIDPDGDGTAGVRGSRENVADTIDNNVRRLIIDETPVNPRFYERLSSLLKDLIDERRRKAIEYAEYLDRIAELARLAANGHEQEYPSGIETPGQKALHDNLGGDTSRTRSVHRIITESAMDGWRDNPMKQRRLKLALEGVIPNEQELDRIVDVAIQHTEY